MKISRSASLISMVFSCLCCCHRNYLFRLYQQNKSSESKVKFTRASNYCKRVLEAAKLAYAHKTKEFITSEKLGCQDFWRIASSVLNISKSTIPPLFNGPEMLSSAPDKVKLFGKTFLEPLKMFLRLPSWLKDHN